MECVLCHSKVSHPVAVTDRGDVYHLRALCSYLAKQLIEKQSERDPELRDMGRIEVEQIVQRKVEGRVTGYFADQLEDCESWANDTTPLVQELALRLATTFISSGRPTDEHVLLKGKMVEIRNELLREENPDDECWLKSVKGYFDGMGAGSWAFMTGCVAIGVIFSREVGRSLGLVQTKGEEDRKPPTIVVDPNRLAETLSRKV